MEFLKIQSIAYINEENEVYQIPNINQWLLSIKEK